VRTWIGAVKLEPKKTVLGPITIALNWECGGERMGHRLEFQIVNSFMTGRAMISIEKTSRLNALKEGRDGGG